MSEKKVLITGGAGFIGSHLVENWLYAGAQVCVYDDLSTGRLKFLPLAHSGLHFHIGNILDAERLSAYIADFRPDYVYHLAAMHYIPACEADPKTAIRINVEGTQNVLSACINLRKKPLIIFASTGAIYDIIDGPIEETFPLRPLDVYGVTKLSGEQLVSLHCIKTEQPAIIARLFNTVGDRETNPHLIPEVLDQIIAGNEIIEIGNISPRRDYIHVQDVADALFGLAALNPNGPEIFNIGSGTEYSVVEVLDLISQVADLTLDIQQAEKRKRKVDRPGQLANTAKIKQRINFVPRCDLRKALFDAFEERKAFYYENSA